MVDSSKFRHWVQEKVVADGLVHVYKPYGIPSTALVEMYKKVTGLKVGHGGTLDPLAEGALLLGIGAGTKLLSKYLVSEKRYRTDILIGASTFSGDLELPIELAPSFTAPASGRIASILGELEKGFTQKLPALNASKQNGKTAYSLIREGKTAEERLIETKLLDWTLVVERSIDAKALAKILEDIRKKLHSTYQTFYEIGSQVGYRSEKYGFLLEKWDKNLTESVETVNQASTQKYALISVDVLVPKGTYIRSLAQDIASRMGTVGVVLRLERVSASGKVSVAK